MLSRRRFIFSSVALSVSALFSSQKGHAATTQSEWYMPDEGENHQCTWMAFGPNAAIWGKQLVPEVQRSLATLANTLVKYEPVRMLVPAAHKQLAQSLLDEKVELITCPINDVWMRDTGPCFVLNEAGNKAAVKLNFNGWGNKQRHDLDAKVAEFIAKQAQVNVIKTSLVLEGGCFEVDGQGTAIITESCVLNNNRNPGVSKAQFEDKFMPLMGLDKIIWLPGVKGKDITDGHTDFYARFAKPGVVIAGLETDPESYEHELTLKHLEILKAATDAQGKKLTVITLEGPSNVRPAYANDEFAAGYIGYYVCNKAVIMSEFGDKTADKAAKRALQQAFPDRIIEAINVDGIAAGGGSIHCVTQQEPMLKP